jgi:hypothetical protein
MKKCNKCNTDKELSEFHKDKKNLDGHSNRCKECVIKHNKERYKLNKNHILSVNKQYRDKNKKRISQERKKYYQLNSKEIKQKTSEYSKVNRESLNKKRKEKRNQDKDKTNKKARDYRNKNKGEINKKRNVQIKKRVLIDPIFKLSRRIRSMLNGAFKIKGLPKTKNLNEILGISIEELKNYLESKFEPWMTWDNHGKYNGELNFGWDIDHIIPLSSAKTEEEIIKLNYYTNLQPLCSKVNRDIKKGN